MKITLSYCSVRACERRRCSFQANASSRSSPAPSGRCKSFLFAGGLALARTGVDSLSTNCRCISRPVATSMNTSKVHCGRRSSNHQCSQPVNLHELANALAPGAGLMDALPPLLAIEPQPSLDHPQPQCLTTEILDLRTVPLGWEVK